MAIREPGYPRRDQRPTRENVIVSPTPGHLADPGGTGPPDDLNLKQAARLLGVHYLTVYRYMRNGLLPARRQGQIWLVDLVDLEDLRRSDGRPQDECPSTGRTACSSGSWPGTRWAPGRSSPTPSGPSTRPFPCSSTGRRRPAAACPTSPYPPLGPTTGPQRCGRSTSGLPGAHPGQRRVVRSRRRRREAVEHPKLDDEAAPPHGDATEAQASGLGTTRVPLRPVVSG